MKTAQRILAVLVILGIAFAAPASVLAQAPPYTVAFTIVRVTPASATVRAVITGPNIPTSMTVAILNYDEVLAGLTPQQATVQVVQKITMTDVVQSTAAKEQHVTETQATTIDDVIAAAPDAATKAELRTLDGKQISAVAKAIKGVAVAKGGGNLTAEEAKLHALSATAKAALDTHPVTKTVQYAKQLAQTAPVQMRDKRTEKTLTNLQSVPLAGGTRTVEFDVQTGKMATWDGKFGSRAVLALIINGTYYYDLTHSSWWNASWLYRKALSFNASGLSATLTDFPVKVSLTSANFDFAQAKSDGTDVRFLGSDDATPLSYEIAYWNQAGQVGTLWVKVPSLTALGNYSQFIYMYHGNAAAADAQDKNATWGSYSTINTADATTNWASTGGAMTITLDNADKKEGTGSVQGAIAVPVIGNVYDIIYSAPASFDLSQSGQLFTVWTKSDRASTAYTTTRLYLYDTNGYFRFWDLVYSANTWTFFAALGTSGNGTGSAGTLNLAAVTQVQFYNIAADVTGFTNHIDWLESRTGAVGVWHMAEGSGTSVGDSTRYGLTLTATAPTWVTGGGVTFNGTTSTFSYPADAARPQFQLTPTRELTVTFWINLDPATGATYWFSQDAGHAYSNAGVGNGMRYNTPLAAEVYDSGYVPIKSTQSLEAVVFSMIAGNVKFYENATLKNTMASPALVQMTAPAHQLVHVGWSPTLKGTLSEIVVYQEAKSATWVLADNMNRLNTLLFYGGTDATATVTTGAATGVSWPIGGTTATLNGNLTSLGADPSATVGFDYGITSAYGQSSPTSVVSATGAYTAAIGHFPPSVSIYYRAKATNSYGTVYGAGSSFMLSDNQRGLLPTLITVGMVTVGLVVVGTTMRGTVQRNPLMSVVAISIAILLAVILVPAMFNVIGI